MSKDKKPLICNWTKDKDDLSKYDLGFISGFKHKEDQICSSEVLEFTEWKDDNFLMYRDKTYYSKTSSPYFDITKYTSKEKPTKYYTLKELFEKFKKK